MNVRHFIETDDFTKEEYLEMLKVIKTLKDAELDACIWSSYR